MTSPIGKHKVWIWGWGYRRYGLLMGPWMDPPIRFAFVREDPEYPSCAATLNLLCPFFCYIMCRKRAYIFSRKDPEINFSCSVFCQIFFLHLIEWTQKLLQTWKRPFNAVNQWSMRKGPDKSLHDTHWHIAQWDSALITPPPLPPCIQYVLLSPLISYLIHSVTASPLAFPVVWKSY